VITVTNTTGAGSGANKTDFDDSSLRGGDDEHNGKWIVCTSGSNNGSITRVEDYDATYRVTVSPAVGTNFGTADTYELWEVPWNPKDINRFINQAITDATGRVFDPEEDITLHGDGTTAKFSIPSEFDMINRVERRIAVSEASIHSCGSAWDELNDTDVTVSLDTKDYKRSGGSNKMVIGASMTAADIIMTENITSLNLSGYTHIEFWMKSTVAEAEGGLQLLLDNTASWASPLETRNVPARVADTWKFCRVALANPETDTAIISVGLKYTTDIGAATLWIDDIRAVKDGSEVWEKVPMHLWKIDGENRKLILSEGGRSFVGYRMLKLIGGGKPALMTAETTVCEIDDDYVIAAAIARALASQAGGASTDPHDHRRRSEFWTALAEEKKRSLPMLVNARRVG
jgi:hypothetical protein